MPQYDEFDDNENGVLARLRRAFGRGDSAEARRPVFAFAIVGLLTALLAAVLIVSYPHGSGRDGAVPIIRADAQPVKSAPDEQGGMDIPNRESTVFNSMRAANPDSKVENLLPQTEQPVDRSKVFAGLKTDPQDRQQNLKIIHTDASATAAAMASAVEPAAEADAPVKLAQADIVPSPKVPTAGTSTQLGSAPGFAPQPIPTTTSADPATVSSHLSAASAAAKGSSGKMTIKNVMTPPQAASSTPSSEGATEGPMSLTMPKPTVTSDPLPDAKPAVDQETIIEKPTSDAGTGSRYIQLASIKDRDAAGAAWKNLQSKFPDQLSGAPYRVQEASVNGNMFYRIQAGPFGPDKAKSVCGGINAKKPGACIAVRG